MALAMILTLAPTTGFADEITPEPLSGDVYFHYAGGPTTHDVLVNGVPTTIYCLQEDYVWPGGESQGAKDGPYYKSSDDHPFLTAQQLQVLRRVMFAGYPHDTFGWLREYAMEIGYEEWYEFFASDITQRAIWELMARWGISGNYSSHDDEELVELYGSTVVLDLIDYGLNGANISAPSSTSVAVHGSAVFSQIAGGSWKTGALSITDPAGFGIFFNMTLPTGVRAVDEAGNELSMLRENEAFYLVTDDPSEIPSDGKLRVSSTFTYPSEIAAYETDLVDEDAGPYQSMLSVSMVTMNLNGSLPLSAGAAQTVKVEGSKTWDDNDDLDGSRPSSIIVRLHADGIEIDHKEVSASDDWKWNFGELPKYKDGSLVEYSVTEDHVAGYSTTYSGYDITNHYTPGKTSVTVEKHWEDSHDQDGIRPETVTVKLLADGADTGKTVTLSEANVWEGSFNDLDEKAAGAKITYTVQEVEVSGYTDTVSGDADHGFVITNSHTPATVTVAGSKTWDDHNDQDGKRPESIQITLHADGRALETRTVTATDGWAWKWTGLPEREAGEMISYTVTEEEVENYTTVYSHDGYDITNTYTPGKVSVSVEKAWNDNHNQDGMRPTGVTIRLLANTHDTGKTLFLSDSNHWSGDFTDLDEYKDGERIHYSVSEEPVDGYSGRITGTEHDGFTVTNSHVPETVDVEGSKIWDDKDNQDGKRPSSITVRLHADGIEIDHKEISASDGWKWTFGDLPKYKDGSLVEYSVTEDHIPDYSTTYSGYDITNHYTPGKTSVTVEKHWDDSHDQDGKRPETVTVKLLADGVDTGKTVTLSEANRWEDSFTDLDEKAEGAEITYTVQEVEVPGYTNTVNGDANRGFVIINAYTPETVSVAGSKTWDDNDNRNGKRPEGITVRLHSNGTEIAHKYVTAAESWSWSFSGLPKFDKGTAVRYTITEDAVDEYSTTYSGYDVTNSYTPGKVSLAVSKVWDDENDKNGKRPESIIVTLVKNGEDTETTLVLSEENNWEGSFTNLDEYTNDVRNVYTVKENSVDGYTSAIIGDEHIGYTIINSYTPESEMIDDTSEDGPEEEISEDKGKIDDQGEKHRSTIDDDRDRGNSQIENGEESESDDKYRATITSDDETPKTGDSSNIFLWMILLLFSGFIFISTMMYNRTKRQKAE